ncbi:aminoglycoside phosphotransferase family protein [Actinoplanes sp. NPDC051411]|uniref:phosphotransferase family protein n=1 Tax=Actinoplanes sp. NPDC051411 TaxID=3155522 RepID=UPI003438E06B
MSEALSWAAEIARQPVRVVRPLLGGTHAVTVLLDADGQEMVLRRYPPGDDAPAREARVLRALDGLGGWAPKLLGADPAHGLILITRLPGTADIMPADPRHAAAELARGLARIHATPPPALRDGMTALSRDEEPRLADAEHVLTHFDYWSGNVLWEGPALTGIVDWSGASLAPRGLDVSWCRLDLVLLHGPEVADVFLRAYERAAATTVPDVRLWDLFALNSSRDRIETWEPNYTSLGRTDLTGAELRARHTRWSIETGS